MFTRVLLPLYQRLGSKAIKFDPVRHVTVLTGSDISPPFWFIEPGQPLVLVASDADQAREAARHLVRIGLDNLSGFLTTDMPEWSAGPA